MSDSYTDSTFPSESGSENMMEVRLVLRPQGSDVRWIVRMWTQHLLDSNSQSQSEHK